MNPELLESTASFKHTLAGDGFMAVWRTTPATVPGLDSWHHCPRNQKRLGSWRMFVHFIPLVPSKENSSSQSPCRWRNEDGWEICWGGLLVISPHSRRKSSEPQFPRTPGARKRLLTGIRKIVKLGGNIDEPWCPVCNYYSLPNGCNIPLIYII